MKPSHLLPAELSINSDIRTVEAEILTLVRSQKECDLALAA